MRGEMSEGRGASRNWGNGNAKTEYFTLILTMFLIGGVKFSGVD